MSNKLQEKVNQLRATRKETLELHRKKALLERNILSLIDMGYKEDSFNVMQEFRAWILIAQKLMGQL